MSPASTVKVVDSLVRVDILTTYTTATYQVAKLTHLERCFEPEHPYHCSNQLEEKKPVGEKPA